LASRSRGYAFDDEEHAVGLRCIASPVFDKTGEAVAAVSVSGPTLRLGEERLPHLGKIVLRTARALSAEIGGANSGDYSSDFGTN
jgi:IclR family acetate operon transcriptional repressor